MYLEAFQTPKIVFFVRIGNGFFPPIASILNVWKGFEHVSIIIFYILVFEYIQYIDPLKSIF